MATLGCGRNPFVHSTDLPDANASTGTVPGLLQHSGTYGDVIRYAFRKQQTQWLGRIEALTARHWPELTSVLDFRRHGSVSNVFQAIVSMMKTFGEQNSPEADSTIGAHRPRYPLSGSVPAEPDSVSRRRLHTDQFHTAAAAIREACGGF